MTLLTDDADVATWNNQGLPSDRMSTENATILCNTERWPLIVDAQLQGIKWIKNKYGSELKAIRLGQKRCGWCRAGLGGGEAIGISVYTYPSGPTIEVDGHALGLLCLLGSWGPRVQPALASAVCAHMYPMYLCM